ncbi:hypothetical protein AXG93_3960s1500 [Marchantia polymorpha subsp. ruderalis]|uniref:DDE-1 domain-containing protein n=1 Tax=Marchantia polymorpha subsp. ruderalis TaxID=1480154 RepID=A0A176VH55_MARPO|nr:hypothetical protein AXG93_3960s1500 [Marchantia polymorpha subsp. ruderalis]
MINEVRITLCEHKQKHPLLTQADLIKWFQVLHKVSISQGTISLTLKRSVEILAKEDVNQAAKRQRTVKYPLMETTLYRWFLTYQDQVNMSGIIRNLKAYYRRRFNHFYIQLIQDKIADPVKIDVIEAMRIAVAVWSMDVKTQTIRNCFRHWQLCTIDADVTLVLKQLLIDPDVIKGLKKLVQELRYRNPMDIRNLIDYLVQREVAYVLTQEKIVQDLSTNPVLEDELEAKESQEYTLVKTTEALQCASLLQQFSMQQDIVDHEMIATIETVKDKISIMRSSKLIQKSILEYFSKV